MYASSIANARRRPPTPFPRYIDTVFMCFLIDKSKGVVTKPEIHQVLGVVLERQGKQLQQTPGGQFALAHPPPPAYHATQPTAMP